MAETTKKNFDPTDPKWALDASNFPPDKESTYNHPASEDGWTHAHNALRMELQEFTEALDAVQSRKTGEGSDNVNEWEVNCIIKWWNAHKEHVTSHHETEDLIFNPFFRTRIKYPKKLETDHTGLVQMLNDLEKCFGNMQKGRRGDSPLTRAQVSSAKQMWESYATEMRAHLKEEEEVGLPLSRAYFTAKELAPKVQEVLATAPKSDLGAFIYCMGPEKFRGQFMKQESIPFFVWWVGGLKSKHQYYVEEIVSQIKALKSGIPPPQPRTRSMMPVAAAMATVIFAVIGFYGYSD